MKFRALVLAAALTLGTVLPTGIALAHGESSNGCRGLDNASSQTHDNGAHDKRGHDETHHQRDQHHCDE